MRLRELFYLHKSDRQVLLVLLSLAAIILFVLQFTGSKQPEQGGGEAGLSADTLRAAQQPLGQSPAGDEPYAVPSTVRHERFTFDPNTADSTQLLRLGLRPWQVRNIYRYRARGGIFRSKEDFARLYGLTVKEYRSLEPLIRISPDYQPASTLVGNASKRYSSEAVGDASQRYSSEAVGNASKRYSSEVVGDASKRCSSDAVGNASQRYSSEAVGNASQRYDSLHHSPRYPVKLHPGETIDLNTLDTTDLKTVPGIGSYYARRIADYGRRLGGYVSVDQLDEIDNFPTGAKAFFAITIAGKQHRLAINRLSLNELRRHPYINYYQARAIADYRRLHGPIASLSDLRLLPEFPPEAIERLEPYVSYE